MPGAFCFVCFRQLNPVPNALPACKPVVYDFAVGWTMFSTGDRMQARKEASVGPKGTILIVDDEPDVREVLEEYLGTHGYVALGAESAGAARGMFARHKVDLALVDINMPGEDGLSFARHVRERHPGVGVVMLTSADAIVDRIVGLEIGAYDYVSKPFDPRELVAG